MCMHSHCTFGTFEQCYTIVRVDMNQILKRGTERPVTLFTLIRHILQVDDVLVVGQTRSAGKDLSTLIANEPLPFVYQRHVTV